MVNKKKIRPNRYVKKKQRFVKHAIFAIKILAILSSVTIMGFMFIFCYDVTTQCDYFKAKKVVVEGIQKISKKEILYQSRIKEEVNILSVNLSLARNLLMAHPLIDEASVKRELPDQIIIKIEEYMPFAVIDLGREFVVNSKGEIYKERDKEIPDNLPVISGLKFSDLNVPGEPRTLFFESVMQVLELVQKPESIFMNNRIKSIHVDREMGLTIYCLDRVKAVKIGYDNYKSKFDKLEKVLLYLEKRKKFSDLESVDLNNLNRIVVKPATIKKTGHKEV